MVREPRTQHASATSLGILLTVLVLFGCPPAPPPGDDVVAPPTVGGTLNVRNFSVPAGRTTRVTSDLVINATGDIRIDGEMIAEPTLQPGARGASIRLLAGGQIEIHGSVQAGDGAAGAASAANMLAREQPNLTNPPGGDGGELELNAGTDLTINNGARVGSGAGGAGGGGPLGGAGGKGGDVKFGAGATLFMRGMVVFGNGGDGGSPSGGGGQSGSVIGGTGGDSAVLFLTAGTVDWADYDPVDHSLALQNGSGTWAFEGGLGGAAPSAFISDSVNLTAAPAYRTGSSAQVIVRPCAGDTCEYRAARGGDGFWAGGPGGFISVVLAQRPAGMRDGPVVRVYGGAGGNLSRKPDSRYGSSVLGRYGHAGVGGTATVIAPPGANGNDAQPDGGFGGTAIAYGGAGGQGFVSLLQFGGDGGAAEAFGGVGGEGDDGCAAGDGGAGGIANAYGGTGGSAGLRGLGGSAHADGGDGGRGGDGGALEGSGGRGGSGVARVGAEGQFNGVFLPQPSGGAVQIESDGADGEDGTAGLHECD